jgi:hypothetical protein
LADDIQIIDISNYLTLCQRRKQWESGLLEYDDCIWLKEKIEESKGGWSTWKSADSRGTKEKIQQDLYSGAGNRKQKTFKSL